MRCPNSKCKLDAGLFPHHRTQTVEWQETLPAFSSSTAEDFPAAKVILAPITNKGFPLTVWEMTRDFTRIQSTELNYENGLCQQFAFYTEVGISVNELIKRMWAVPVDKIESRNPYIYINGKGTSPSS